MKNEARDTDNLENIKLNTGRIAASGGSKLITGTSPVTIDATSFYVRENTVISALTGVSQSGATQNFVTLFNISGAALVQGDLFIAPNWYTITSITLTSGSVIVYK